MKTTTRRWLLTATAATALVGCSSREISEGVASEDTVAPIEPASSSPSPEETAVPAESTTPEETAVPEETAMPQATTNSEEQPVAENVAMTQEAATEAPNEADQAIINKHEIAGAPMGVTGDRSNPVPFGDVADLGSGWRMQILEIVPSGAAAVAQENQFNEPPPPGSDFTLVKAAVGYFGLDDPKSLLMEPSISALGAAGTELSEDCGVVPNELDVMVDVFAGGVVTGNLCFVTTPDDVAALQVYATGELFTGDDVFLAATGAPSGAPQLATVPGIQDGAAASVARSTPMPIGTSADIGDGWSAAITGPAYDITDAVAAENQFNEPPPEGFRFVGVDLTLAYNGDGSDNAFTVTTDAVSAGNVSLSSNCGVVPNELDVTADVFTGGTIAGATCFVVPADQISGLVPYLVAGLSSAPVMFATA